MTSPLVLTEPLGGGALAAAAIAGTAPRDWYRPRPGTPDEWARHARQTLEGWTAPAWLAALAPALDAGGAARERLEAVRDGRGLVVTTGQQPGLFGGPLYTWHKALSALALADALQRATGIPVAPVFWAATDDTDFAEAAVTWVAHEGGCTRLALPPRADDGRPMAEVPLGDVSALFPVLERGAGAAVAPEVLARVRECYAVDATVGGAYVSLLRRVLEPLGIAVLDAAHPAVSTAADPLLRAALARAAEVDERVAGRVAAIERAGFSAQVPPVPGLSLVFRRDADGTKRRVPLAEAADTARTAAVGELGPNVLLRPVVERQLLPTVAYVAGPGEIAYFAQVGAVADALGVVTPLVVPRWSGTVVEPHVQRLLERHGLRPDDLREPHAVERRVARAALPPEVGEALRSLRAAVEEGIARLAAADEATGLVPPTVPAGARLQLAHRLERLERRHLAAVMRRESALAREVATLRGALAPDGKRQERALNFMPLLARHGPPLLDRLRRATDEHAASLVGVGAPLTGAAASLAG